MTKRTLRLAILALPLTAAAGFAIAQSAGDAPATDAPAAEDARPIPAQLLGGPGRDHDGGRDRGRGHGPRDALGLGGPQGMAEVFAEVDADGDGAVTQSEVDAYLDARLQAADADGNGAVSIEEFAPAYFDRMRPQMVDAFQSLDEDGDAAVTTAELDSRFGSVVERLDRDGDDALTLQDGRRGRD